MIYYLASDHPQKNQFNSNVIQTHVPIHFTMHYVASFLVVIVDGSCTCAISTYHH